jgi:hypothetical protein
MSTGSQLLRRAIAAGLTAVVALCVTLGAVFWKIAASARPRRPSALEALGEPPRVDFWERVDLVLFRGRAANASAAAPAARGAGALGGAAGRGEPARPVAAAAPDPYRQTAAADERDLAAALIARGLPEARRRSLLDQVRRLREALQREDEAAGVEPSPGVERSPGAVDTDPAGAVVAAVPRRAPPVDLAVPPGLPAEFAAYLEGALAYRRGDLAAARARWQELLALPEEARRQRSTWAAFMLGRTALRRQPRDLAAAVGWFRRTRELAAHGFADSLGLAVLSLGWEARAEAARRHFDRAEALYAQQARAGDASAVDSLRIFWRERLIRGFLGQ